MLMDLRVDAVASMLYLDYGKTRRSNGFRTSMAVMRIWRRVDFFKHLNSVVLGRNPGALMIAEESTAWPKVTGDAEDGGLGFSLEVEYGVDARLYGIYEAGSIFQERHVII